MANPTDLEFARELWFAENVPATFMPADCPRIVVTFALESVVHVDVQGNMNRFLDWVGSRPGHVAAISEAIRLAGEGRGE